MKTIEMSKIVRTIYTINGKPDPMAYFFTIVIVLVIVLIIIRIFI